MISEIIIKRFEITQVVAFMTLKQLIIIFFEQMFPKTIRINF